MEAGKLETAFRIAINLANKPNKISIKDNAVATSIDMKTIKIENRTTNGTWIVYDVLEERVDIQTYEELWMLAKRKREEIVQGELDFYIADCERQINNFISTNSNYNYTNPNTTEQ